MHFFGGETDEITIPERISGSSRLDYPHHIPPSVYNILHVLVDQAGFEYWNADYFPPMSKATKDPAVICVQQYVIVAAGVSDCDLDKSVEVMNIKSETWFQVASLPEAVSSLTAACCGDQLYFLGGRDKNGSTSSVFTCSVRSLIMHSDFYLGKKLRQQASENPVWQKAADVPVLCSTCVAINDQLFAVGGRTSRYRPLSDIYCCHPLHDSWQIAGQMPTARSLCIAAFVTYKLVVVGGSIKNVEPIDVVETGTFISGMLTCNRTK